MSATKSKLRRTAAGELVTAQLIESLAQEAEAGYDLAQAKRQRIGRPSLGAEGLSPRIAFRVDSKTYSTLRAVAAASNRPISSLAREALKRYLESGPR